MIANVTLYKLIEEMGQEGMLNVPDLHGDSCEACHIVYKTGCRSAPSVLSVACGEDIDSTKEVLTREADSTMYISAVIFDAGADLEDTGADLELAKLVKSRYDGITDIKLNDAALSVLTNHDVDTLFDYVTRTKSTPLENFNDITDVKDYILSSVNFCFKLTQVISELKLEAEIAVL